MFQEHKRQGEGTSASAAKKSRKLGYEQELSDVLLI